MTHTLLTLHTDDRKARPMTGPIGNPSATAGEQLAAQAKLRQRPGDQQLPVGNDRPGAHDQVIALLVARRELGLERYGQLLQPHNGRDTGRDLVEELLDGVVYAQTLAVELAELRGLLTAVRLTVDEARAKGTSLPLLEALLAGIPAAAGGPVDPRSATAAVLRCRALVATARRNGWEGFAGELEAALDGPDQ